MSVELLRQLDAYGDHLETLIDHVGADEVRERALLSGAKPVKRRRRQWRKPVFVTASALGGLVLVVAGLTSLDTRVDSNFDQVGFDLGGEDVLPASAPEPRERALTAQDLTSAFLPEASAEIGGGELQPLSQTPTTAAPATTAAPGQPEVLPDPQAGRDIVFVADVRVSVSDADDAGDRATLIVESLGGFLSGEQSTGGANATRVLTFKVPPQAFRDAVDRLGDLGVVTERVVTADDVTDRVVDLESQIASAEVSVERLRAFLAAATDVDDVAKLERELTNRERDLEQLRGQLATLASRVDLATIRVSFSEAIQTPKIRLGVGAYEARDDEGASCPGQRPAEVETGTDATVCIVVTNDGKTQLTDVALSGDVMALLTGNLIAVEGDIDTVLEPGDVVIVATDLTVDQRLRADLTVTAVPVNEAGDAVPDREITATTRLAVDIADPGGLPGFGDAWERGTSALATTGSIALIILGAILPWLWLPVVIGLVVWWRRRR